MSSKNSGHSDKKVQQFPRLPRLSFVSEFFIKNLLAIDPGWTVTITVDAVWKVMR